MAEIYILYTSIAGNTRSFVDKLTKKAKETGLVIKAKEISDASDYEHESQPFVAIVPTYLEGGTGTGPEVREIFTNALGEYIEFGNNHRQLQAVIGSGNRNFNVQYLLTATRYAKKYQVPEISGYELRGTNTDVIRILDELVAIFEKID